MRGQCDTRCCFRSPTLILSMPAAPLFDTTRCKAAIMLSRLTIISISCIASFGCELDDPAVTFDAPKASSRSFRPLPSAWAWGVSAPLSASAVVIERSFSIRHFMFSPSPSGTATTASADFCRPIPSLLSGGSTPLPVARRQISRGKTRDLHAIYLSHLQPHHPGDIGLWVNGPPCPDATASYALPVRQAGTLLTASFRPRLTTTPLLFG